MRDVSLQTGASAGLSGGGRDHADAPGVSRADRRARRSRVCRSPPEPPRARPPSSSSTAATRPARCARSAGRGTLPLEPTRATQRHRQPEDSALPRRIEHDLAVVAGRRHRADEVGVDVGRLGHPARSARSDGRRRSSSHGSPAPTSSSGSRSSGALGSFRENEVARLGRAVPHPDRARRPGRRHPSRPAPSAAGRPCASGTRLGLVPPRRQPEHRPRVAGAERAHDDVVDVGACSRPTISLAASGPPNPSSAIALVPSASSRSRYAGSVQARATTLAPLSGPTLVS